MPAAHLFMKLYGPGKSLILGESQVEEYAGQIVIDDWSWALVRKREQGKAESIEPSVFSFSKALDRSTTALLNCLRSGGVLPSAEVTLEEASEADFELVLRLTDVRVQQYDVDGEVDETHGRVKEKWVFNYHTIELDYKPSKQLSSEQRGALRALMTRPPGASSKSVGDETKDRMLDMMKKLPESERKPMLTTLDRELSALGPDKPDQEKK